ncbi:MAG: cytochrome c maturation protein CcmE [Thalassobaculales bacterium]
MTPRKRRRLAAVALVMLGVGSAAALTLTAFQDNLVFFYSPSDLARVRLAPEQRIRIGGLVEPGSLTRQGSEIHFRVTDNVAALAVRYEGALPDLFREGQGVVAEGSLRGDVFQAREVLAKHDETYMPREVAEALKKAGQWHAPEPAR